MQSVGVSDIPLPLKVGVCSQYVHMGMRIVNFHRISESEVTPLPPKYTYVSFNTWKEKDGEKEKEFICIFESFIKLI